MTIDHNFVIIAHVTLTQVRCGVFDSLDSVIDVIVVHHSPDPWTDETLINSSKTGNVGRQNTSCQVQGTTGIDQSLPLETSILITETLFWLKITTACVTIGFGPRTTFAREGRRGVFSESLFDVVSVAFVRVASTHSGVPVESSQVRVNEFQIINSDATLTGCFVEFGRDFGDHLPRNISYFSPDGVNWFLGQSAGRR